VSALRLGVQAGAPLQTVSFAYFYARNLVLWVKGCGSAFQKEGCTCEAFWPAKPASSRSKQQKASRLSRLHAAMAPAQE
jgi:hypothetical protein